MSRQRPPQTIQKAPLFTFLDVLTCTMGLLILLLVAIARQARIKTDDAVQTAQATAQVSQEEWDKLQQKLVATRSARTHQAEQLSRRRAELGAAEASVRRLRDEMAELERARRLLEESLLAGSSASEQAELASVRGRIAELEASLKKALAAGSKTSYAIVPYEGHNQTRRRPIYIECRADKIVLQPEGIELRERDFDGPLDNSNVLASAVRAAEQHLGGKGPAGEPYPFLVVRPDGVNAYYIARAALRSWGSEFGYELVDADWQLDFKTPDPALLAVEANAVEEARERQRFLGYAGMGIGGGSFSGISRGRPGGFGAGEEEPAQRGSFRVGADGRMVREGGSSRSSIRPRTGGSRLGRYAEITGDKEGSPAERFGSQAGSPASEGSEAADTSLAETSVAPPSMAQQEQSASGEPGSLFSKPAANSARPGQTGQSGGIPGQSSPDTAVATDQKGPTILPQKMFGQNQAAESGSPSLAESHGKNWALPDSSRGSIPVTRPISVQCLEDRLIILPEGPSNIGRRELPFAGQTSNVINGLVTVVWDRMENWGIAGKGMYWRPELHVQTMPGGSVRLVELKLLLKDSGIVIVEKPAPRTALKTR